MMRCFYWVLSGFLVLTSHAAAAYEIQCQITAKNMLVYQDRVKSLLWKFVLDDSDGTNIESEEFSLAGTPPSFHVFQIYLRPISGKDIDPRKNRILELIWKHDSSKI